MTDIFRSAEYARAKIARMAVGTPEHQALFGCKVCGVICGSSPGPGKAVCEAHCEDHDFQYSRDLRTHACRHCEKPVDHDWYDD